MSRYSTFFYFIMRVTEFLLSIIQIKPVQNRNRMKQSSAKIYSLNFAYNSSVEPTHENLKLKHCHVTVF